MLGTTCSNCFFKVYRFDMTSIQTNNGGRLSVHDFQQVYWIPGRVSDSASKYTRTQMSLSTSDAVKMEYYKTRNHLEHEPHTRKMAARLC